MTMTSHERQLYVSRIVTGVVPLKCRDDFGSIKQYFAYPPSALDRLRADELYLTTYEQARFQGVLTDDEMLQAVVERDLWSANKQQELEALPKQIEEFKVGLFNSYFNGKQRDRFRKMLKKAKERQQELLSERHAFDVNTCEGVARLARSQYLLGCNLRDATGRKLWDDDSFFYTDTRLIDVALNEYYKRLLTEPQIRELSRTEPWRSIWVCGKTESSVFGKPSSDFTEEQKAIVLWSRTYDSISEHPESPPDEVVGDDDLLDGWLIIEHNKREQEQKKKYGDSFFKKKDAGEWFIPASTPEDVARIEAMNDAQARMVKKQRFAMIERDGRVMEQHMPDSKNRVRQMAAQMQREHIKGNKK